MFFQQNVFLHCYRLLLCVWFLQPSTLKTNRSRRIKRLWYKILIRLKVDSPCIHQQFLLAAVIRIKSYANELSLLPLASYNTSRLFSFSMVKVSVVNDSAVAIVFVFVSFLRSFKKSTFNSVKCRIVATNWFHRIRFVVFCRESFHHNFCNEETI